MACPDFQSFILPILQIAGDGSEMSLASLRDEVVRRLGLTESDLSELLPSGRQTKFANRANWACMYLNGAGLFERPRRSIYRITPRGREVLANPPERIDVPYLMRYPEFRSWTGREGGDADDTPTIAVLPANEPATPEEQLAASYTTLRRRVEDDLLQRILAEDPHFFEELVIELLVAMGYGGSRAEAEAVGRSGDGGVDGIIKEDRLGLDAIYVQAKRWAPGNKVSRPDVQAFAGSLEGLRARKGVFITTSAFSREAHDYVSRIEKKIILIDGPELAKLLFEHDVGVRTKHTYEVKEVDEEYFIDD